jgi:hypothetical protein
LSTASCPSCSAVAATGCRRPLTEPIHSAEPGRAVDPGCRKSLQLTPTRNVPRNVRLIIEIVCRGADHRQPTDRLTPWFCPL